MPNKPVTLRRWEVVAAFVLLTATFVFSIALVNRESKNRTNAICETSVDNRNSIRLTVQSAKTVALAAGNEQPDPDVTARTNAFFDAILSQIPPLTCVEGKPIEEE